MLDANDIARLLDVANAGLNKGEVALARRVYDGILAARPDHVGAALSKALSHIAVGECAEADAVLLGILERLPEDGDALVYLGLSASLSGRQDEARGWLERVPEDNASAWRLAQELLARL